MSEQIFSNLNQSQLNTISLSFSIPPNGQAMSVITYMIFELLFIVRYPLWNGLMAASPYRMRMSATNDAGTSTVDLTFITNAPPTIGSLLVSLFIH